MARKRPPIKPDPLPVIKARMRMAPEDQSIVLAKMSDSTIVKVKHNGTFVVGKSADGNEILVTPRGPMVADAQGRLHPCKLDSSVFRYDSLVDQATSAKLKTGIAEGYQFYWVNQHPMRVSQVRGRQWCLVSKKDNEVFCPYAYGDKTDDNWHMGDVVLHKRAIEIHNAERGDLNYYNDPERYMAEMKERNAEIAASSGIKNFDQSVEMADEDAVSIGVE